MSLWSLAHTQGNSTKKYCWLAGWSFTPLIFETFWKQIPGEHWVADYHTEVLNMNEMASLLAIHAPKEACWIGWSLGGALSCLAAEPAEAKQVISLATAKQFIASSGGVLESNFSVFNDALVTAPTKALTRFRSLCAQGASSPKDLVTYLRKYQLPYSSDLVHTLNWLKEYQLSSYLKNSLHLYSSLDALAPTPLEPMYISKNKSHAFFLESDELVHIILGKDTA